MFDKFKVCTLVGLEWVQNDLGAQVYEERRFDAPCAVGSVGLTEYMQAQAQGIMPVYKVTTNAGNYHGERVAIIDGTRYTIYRVYLRRDDNVELYLKVEAGFAS